MNLREDKKQTQDWAEGEVAVFFWLHEDKARRVGSKPIRRSDKGGKEETIHFFEVEGKPCPCLILGQILAKRGRYFKIVRLTEEKNAGLRLDGVDNLKGISYLPADATQIRWIHSKLAGRWIGLQDCYAFAHVLKELNHRGLHSARSDSRTHTPTTPRK